MPAEKKSVAFFGATGGCAIACLHHALENGYDCHALVRSETKLRTLLQQRGVSTPAIQSNLTVVTGDIKDPTAVTRALFPSNRTVDTIISGIGLKPTFKPNPLKPTLSDPRICTDAVATILTSLRSLPPGPRPNLIAVSTTGISEHGRDIPVAMVPLYHWLLAVPHADKKEMEALLAAEMTKRDGVRGISGYMCVRPSLLTDGGETELGKIKVGTGKEPKIGYTISRDDVGMWMFERGVKGGNGAVKGRGDVVCITY